MATVADVSSVVTEIQTISTTVLSVLETADPAITVPATIAEELLTLAAKALAAWSAASGVAITAESVQALLPNQTPLTAPTS